MFKLSLKPKRVVFYHIPRSGGRSLYKFYDFYINEKIYNKNDYRTFKDVNFKFSHVVRKIHRKENPNTNYLIILRDPFERMVSRYMYLRDYAANNTLPTNIIQKYEISFEEYLEGLEKYGNDNLLIRIVICKLNEDYIFEKKNMKTKKIFYKIKKKDVAEAKKKLKNFKVVMFKDLNNFNWTNYFTNLKINFPMFHINNNFFYEKIKMKKKYLKYFKYDLELYNFFLNKKL